MIQQNETIQNETDLNISNLLMKEHNKKRAKEVLNSIFEDGLY